MLKNHHEFIKEKGYKVEHFILTRTSEYNPNGRNQTEEEAILFDTEIREMLDSQGIKYHTIYSKDSAVDEILSILGV